MEGCALAGDAFGPDLASHEFHQLLTYGQAQTGAITLAAYGSFQLSKWLEDLAHLILRHADARVLDREMDLTFVTIKGLGRN